MRLLELFECCGKKMFVSVIGGDLVTRVSQWSYFFSKRQNEHETKEQIDVLGNDRDGIVDHRIGQAEVERRWSVFNKASGVKPGNVRSTSRNRSERITSCAGPISRVTEWPAWSERQEQDRLIRHDLWLRSNEEKKDAKYEKLCSRRLRKFVLHESHE